MKAPEKIFICDYGSELSYEWHSESEFEAKGHNDIEYTRTDAFIEKVCEYMSYHLDTSKIDVNYKFEFIEEIRNYMKGV